jgi:thiamine pyrophosphate-dependent acetolactate synthase large subunit-like protein
VAALDSEPRMRAVLALFEGVATGAADGYARMADKPAATLLHLGCGLGNGLANLHNARKGKVPVVNIVGDHATSHVQVRRPAAVGHRNRGAQRVARLRAHLAKPPPSWARTRPKPLRPPAACPARWPR